MSRRPGLFWRPHRPSALLLGVGIGILAALAYSAMFGPLDVKLDLDRGEASDAAVERIADGYWRDVDPARLEDASVEGMVEFLRERYDDRFSHYFDPEAFEAFESASRGEFSGIGLAVIEVKQGLRVAQVYDGSPAKRAGIAEDDLIVAVEGRSIAGEPAEASTARIKGPPGTEVTIAVRSPGGREREVAVVRAEVRIPAAQGELRRFGGRKIGYVRLLTFSQGAHAELRQEVERVARRGAEGLVLDLRGNGGGLLNEAVLSASVFVEDGEIVSTAGRTQEQRTYEAVGDALPERPMAVLVDRNTASAAEIVAAALADHGLATLVGTRTFGKGTFQEVVELPNGGGLDLTVGEYLTSDGTSLAGKGIRPDVRVREAARAERDEVLRRALSVVAGELR